MTTVTGIPATQWTRWTTLARERTDPDRFERGRHYAEDGCVLSVWREGELDIAAAVQGSDHNPYDVCITFRGAMPGDGDPRATPDDDDIEAFCDCGDDNPACKHIAAVMIVLDQWDDDPEVSDDQDDDHWDEDIDPAAWSSDLPLSPDAFWGGEPWPTRLDGTRPAADAGILQPLGNLDGWVGPPYFENVMIRIYRDASRHAAHAMNWTEPDDPAPGPPAGQQGNTATPHRPARPKIRDHRSCGCPTCVANRLEEGKSGAQARDDTVLPGLYDDYLIGRGYRWTPCGRRLQPPN